MGVTPKQRAHDWYLKNRARLIEQHRNYYLSHREQVLRRTHDYYIANRETIDERRRQQKKTNPEARLRYAKVFVKENPVKVNAYQRVYWAKKIGKLKREPCVKCGSSERVHAHHDDYSKPLNVLWLCPAHHQARHRELSMGVTQ